MDGRTHITGGVLAGAATPLVLAHTGLMATAVTPEHVIPFTIAAMAGGVIGGLLPDIDSPTSLLGRKLHLVSKMVSKTMGHRGFAHTLLATLIWSVVVILGGVSLVHLAVSSTSFIDLFIKSLIEGVFVSISAYFFCEALKGKVSPKLRNKAMMYTFLAVFALGMFLQGYVTALILVYLIGTCVGSLSHLFLDLLTVEGLPLLFPIIKTNVRIANFHAETGGKIVKPICLALTVVCLFFIFKTIVF